MKVTECKTFSMRLRGVSEDGEELSATLREDVMAYTKMTSAFQGTEGFDILKDDGSFKSTFEILKGIGSAWKELTDMQKSKLLQDMFGKLQGNVGAALLENYEKLDQVVNDIENTAGSVDQEFGRYLDSTTGKLNQLSSLIQEKWVNAINSDFTKNVVDGVTKLVDAFGNLGSILAIATTAVLVFKGQALSTLVTDLMAVCAGETAATIATTGLSAAFKGLSAIIASNPIGALAVAITGTIALLKSMETQTERLNKAYSNISNIQSELNSLKEAKDDVSNMGNLTNKINDSNTSLKDMIDAKNELSKVQKKLADTFPDLIDGFTKEGDAIVGNIDKVNKKIKETAEYDFKELQDSYKTIMETLSEPYHNDDDSFLGSIFDTSGISQVLDQDKEIHDKYIKDTNYGYTINPSTTEAYKMYIELKQKDITLTEKQQEDYNTIKDRLEEVNKVTAEAYKKIQLFSDDPAEISEYMDGFQWIDIMTGEAIPAMEYYKKQEKEAAEEAEELTNQIKQLVSEGYTAAQISKTLGVSIDTVAGYMSNLEEETEDAAKAMKNLSDSFDGAVDSISLINTALEEYSNNGGLTDDTISKILNTGDMELIQSLLTEDENYIAKNTALMERYGQAKQQALQDAVNQVNGVAQAEANATNQNAQSYQTDVINKTNAENAKTSAMINSATQGVNATAQLVNTNGKNYNTDATNKTKTENSKVSAMQQAATQGISANAQMINAQGEGYQTDNTNYGRLVNNKVDLAEGGANQSIEAESQATAQKELQYKIDTNNYRKQLVNKRDMLLGMSGGNPTPEINFIDEMLSKVPEQVLVPSPPKYTTVNVDSIQVETVPIVSAPSKSVGGSSGGGSSSSSSSSTDYSLDNLESMRDNLYEINSYIERLETAMGILEAQIDRTWGKDKVDKIRAYNNYLQNQFATTRNLQAQQQKEIFEIRKKLSAYGFDFDSNDITSDITNYNTRIDQLVNEANAMKSVDEASRNAKQKRQEEIRGVKELCDQYEDLKEAINDTKVEYQELATEMQEYYRGLADDVASGESTIATIIENAWEDKANKIKESLDELQQKYEDLWEQEDWEDTKAEAYKELTDLEVEMQKAIKSGDTGKLAQLQEEYNERQEELNKTLRDKEREDLQDKIAQEQELIDKQKEEATTGDNMDKAIEQALKKGYIDLSGEYKTLADATEEYVNKTTDGYESQKLALSDIIKELETVKELYNDISTINSKADVVSDFTTYSNVSVPVNNSGYLMTSNLNSSTPSTLNNQTYNITINAADMTQSELENAIDNVLRDNGVYDN